MARTTTTTNPMREIIERYAFRKSVLIEGPKGTGKTFTVDQFLGEQEDITINFVGGHEGLESTDLLGNVIKTPEGQFAWKDGALTAAFRAAQTGKSVLFFDEILRVPARELNILIAALAKNSKNEFVLRTGRTLEVSNGIAKEEVIKVPVENLWVVATTNVGSQYNVEEADPALADRFRILNYNPSEKTVESILNQYSPNKGTTVKLMRLYETLKGFKVKGELNNDINLRHLVEALELSDGDNEKLLEELILLVPTWADRQVDGSVNSSQEDLILKTIKSIW